MPLVLASPPARPGIPSGVFEHLTYEWVTPAGTYVLSDWRNGILMDNRGVEGLHFPRVTKFSSTSRAQHGKRNRGWRVEPRDVFWPLQIFGDSSAEFLERYRGFFATVHPEKGGTWRVGVDGAFRELQLTGKFDDALAYDLDPVFEGWAPYGVRLEAEFPFWTGAVINSPIWGAPDPVDLIDASGAPSFHRSEGTTFATASIPNPGDVDAWNRWTVKGPWDAGVQLGVGDRLITVPFALSESETLTLDTDPRNVSATVNGVNRTRDLGFQPVVPVPPGKDIALTILANGAGKISASLTPLHLRAF